MLFENLKHSPKSYILLAIFLMPILVLSIQGGVIAETMQVAASTNMAANLLNTTTTQAAATQDVETTAVNSIDLQKGLTGYWRFDNPKASRGYSMEFDGLDDYISIPENSVNSISSNFTASGWLKVDEGAEFDSHTLIQKDSNYGLLFDGQPRIFLEVWDESSNRHKFYSGNISHRINGWTHYAYTVDENDSVKLYLDGSLVNSWSIGFNVSDAGSNSVLIAKRNSNAYYTDGSMDDIRLYRRLLTSTEIKNMYRGLPVSTESLVLHQKFDEGNSNCDVTSSKTCIRDDSSENNYGTPYNFNDNKIGTGSGWIEETPINRPSATESAGKSRVYFQGGNDGYLNNFDFNSSSGWTSGKVGDHSLEFDGSDDTINMENQIWSSDEITISLWALTEENTGTENSNAVFSTDGNDNDLLFQFSSDRLRFWGRTNPESSTNLDYNFEVGKWYHLAVSYKYNTSTVDFYINGEKFEKNGDKFGIPGRKTIHIGSRKGSGRVFPGKIDNVKLYDEKLSSSQINSIYQGQQVRNNLVGEWNFESGDGTTAYDTHYKKPGILGSSSIYSGTGIHGVSSKVSFNESTVSAWYQKDGLPEKVSSTGRRFATYCLLDTRDDQGTFSIASTQDGNRVTLKQLSNSGDVVDTWNKTLNKGQLWRFPCDDYGPDDVFRIESVYPISVDYDTMLDSRTSDDDWTSRAGEDIWFSMPNDNNELTVTAYRNNTEVTLYNRTAGASRSFNLDANEYWSCSDCTNNPAAFNVKTNEDHPVTVLYGKFDDNSGSEIVAPTRKLYRVSKDYSENGQKIHIVAERDGTTVEVTDFAGSCTNTTVTLSQGEVYSDSCGASTINLKVNSSKPASMTLIEASGDYGPSMFRSSTNNWGIGREYHITSSNDKGNSIGIISLAENNQIDISGSFSYSTKLDKYENKYSVGNLPLNGYINIDAEHPVVAIGDAGSNYEAAMAVLPLPKMNVVKAGKSGIGVTKDRVFGFNSGNVVSTKPLAGNNWQNIAITGGSKTSIYVGSERQLATDISSSPHEGEFVIGRVEGKIDEVRIHNRSLSEKEVQRLAFQ